MRERSCPAQEHSGRYPFVPAEETSAFGFHRDEGVGGRNRGLGRVDIGQCSEVSASAVSLYDRQSLEIILSVDSPWLTTFGGRDRVGEIRGDRIVASGASARVESRAGVASERASPQSLSAFKTTLQQDVCTMMDYVMKFIAYLVSAFGMCQSVASSLPE
jgi:hypothetical protein